MGRAQRRQQIRADRKALMEMELSPADKLRASFFQKWDHVKGCSGKIRGRSEGGSAVCGRFCVSHHLCGIPDHDD